MAVTPLRDLKLDEEALFREARRLRRRRWTVGLATLITLAASAGIAYGVIGTGGARPAASRHGQSASGGPPTGAVVALRYPAALAVGPNGHLFVIDATRNQVLERQANGSFRAVAGSGRVGFSGDGGPALRAELDLDASSGLAFSPGGTMYLADTGNNRVRAVSPAGEITTVLGNGASPAGYRSSAEEPLPGFEPTRADDFALGPPAGLAFGSRGVLYVAADEVVKLSPGGTVSWVAGGSWRSPPGSALYEAQFDNSASLAPDGRGDLFVVNDQSFGVGEVTRSGTLLGYGRGFGFGMPDLAEVAEEPDGDVLVAALGIFRIDPSTRVVTEVHTDLDRALDGHGYGVVPYGVAVGPRGTIFLDTNPTDQNTLESALFTLSPTGRVTTLWATVPRS